MKKILLLATIPALLLLGCNLDTSTSERADFRESDCSSLEECNQLISYGYAEFMLAMISSNGAHMNLMADQNTSTNHFRNFYEFADEPRLRLDNRTSFNNQEIFLEIFNALTIAANVGNRVVANQENINPDSKIFLVLQAKILRALSRGYLGLFYDKAYDFDETNYVTGDNANRSEFVTDYTQMVELSLNELDDVIDEIESFTDTENQNFRFDAVPGANNTWNSDQTLDVLNSFAARILAAKSRTFQESVGNDWEAVQDYANKGIGGPDSRSLITDFSVENSAAFFDLFNYFLNLTTSIVTGNFETGAGYLPTDIKIFHLLDETYPVEYPDTALEGTSLSLREVSTDDPRISYYKYTQNLGFLQPNRNRSLFSPYFNQRLFSENGWGTSDLKMTLFTSSETNYLRAEAALMRNEKTNAANILATTPFGTGNTELSYDLAAVSQNRLKQNGISGNYEFDGSESLAEFQLALLREYSVELEGMSGVGIQWVFMRRHDLLQEGTPTMYPLPGIEIALNEMEYYTFGGVDVAGERGTASGENSWKMLREKISGQ